MPLKPCQVCQELVCESCWFNHAHDTTSDGEDLTHYDSEDYEEERLQREEDELIDKMDQDYTP
jgi:hypothetical protein